ncbi:MAG: bifunctional diaminohydroxyphosphoribosylaminopyrimidine deaminase/5-amino-6-(5-phosphoribosylamino)uracil reductase RibD [Deltaproteobacteria bacterium]|nr:MAG: bifunctional diaminohydroxyphosphoribosylaminopyrimidine deaminase/5-amino-6-(5-phosphoribosylamino)uracil reductase RibD [Deltaproteobacteria bacterium]
MDPEELDTRFMRMALTEARKGVGRTSPNPVVGAVIVRKGEVIAKGYHKKVGGPHAEISALEKLGYKAEGCTLYVTLEPCNHYGRTPPCTVAIIRSGISRVVVGMKDPNPNVKGGGCKYLSAQGIEVKVGILEEECRRINESYIKYVQTGRPFVLLKCALTLDGWMATRTGHSKWITGSASRGFVHRLRQGADAVMVGVGTVIKDNPLLTARNGIKQSRQPLRVILDSNLRSPINARIFKTTNEGPVMVVVGSRCKDSPKMDKLKKMGVEIVKSPMRKGMVDLSALMDILGGKEIMTLMVEGGARLNHSLISGKLVDKFYIFLAPRLLRGGDGLPMCTGRGPARIDGGLPLRDLRLRKFDQDIMVVAYPDYEAGRGTG